MCLYSQNVKVSNGVHGYSIEVPKSFIRVSPADFDLYSSILYKNSYTAQKARSNLSVGHLDILIVKEDSAFIKIASENVKIEVDETFKNIAKKEIPRQYLLIGRTNCTIEECEFKKIGNRNVLYIELSYREDNKDYFCILAFLNGRDNVFTTISMVVGKNQQKKYSSVFRKALQTLIIK
ncbi:MAG: hypothetical protein NZ519_12155 [Bacteroidia bacterium]|nr:hypothetical protein [Bacteroidia bacterium]MDW8302767.1 hypothetical protein [Bacteroidia bacterium]